jgi:DUF4097 and DUF4098 domain-containing protein YvlB
MNLKVKKMRNLKLFLILILITALVSGCSVFSRKYQKTVTDNATVSAVNKKALMLENTNGDIRIHKSADSLINIKVEKTVFLKKSELDKDIDWIDINIDTSGKIVKVSIDILRELQFFNFKAGGSTDIDIYVPENLFLSIESTNSDIEFDNVRNDVKLVVSNGKVKSQKLSGNLEAEMTNGKIYAAPDSGKDCNLNVTNGRVYLETDEKTAGNFELSVKNGKIDAGNFKFDTTLVKEKGYLKAKSGNTENRITVKVANGKIKLSKVENRTDED